MTIQNDSSALERYYRFHARVYDATRWSFLFGRAALIKHVAARYQPDAIKRILEVGCGTGKNLQSLCQVFPHAQISGLDLSADMLQQARKNLGASIARVELLNRPYDAPLHSEPAFDLIVFSYCLSMINPGWQEVIDYARRDLHPGGVIAVVDFNASVLAPFKQWMAMNHVKMEGHLLPRLTALFTPRVQQIHKAYGGIWSYFLFIGERDQGISKI